MKTSINKNQLLFNLLIISFYLSIFLPIIRGLLRHVNSNVEFLILLVSQFIIFFTPILLIFIIKLNIIRTLIIMFIIIYVVFIQFFADYFVFRDFIFGMKNLFGSLLFIPLVHHLVINHEPFKDKMLKHIEVIFIITISIISFELLSNYLTNPVHDFFKSLAYNQLLAEGGGRPLGIMLNIHYQGIILAMAIIYFYIKKRFIIFSLAVLVLILSNIKTWTVAISFVAVVYLIKNIYKIKFKNLIIIAIFCMIISILLTYLFYGVVDHYIQAFSDSSYAINQMKSLWFGIFDVIIESVVPIGFFSQSNIPTNFDHLLVFSDAFFVINIYQVGIIGMCLYLVVILYTLPKKHTYTSITLLSLFSIIHTNPLVVPGILIMVTYFGYFYVYENKQKLNFTKEIL